MADPAPQPDPGPPDAGPVDAGPPGSSATTTTTTTASDPNSPGPADAGTIAGTCVDDDSVCINSTDPTVAGAPDASDPNNSTSPPDNSTAPAAKGAQSPNTMSAITSVEPIVDPPVRLFCQYGGTWGTQPLRPPAMRNGKYAPKDVAPKKPGDPPRKRGDPNSWADNGCYPVCLAMLLRWFTEDYPPTISHVQFPTSKKPGAPAAFDPVEMCLRFNGTQFFDCVLGIPMVARCPTCNAAFSDKLDTGLCGGNCGTDLSTLDPTTNIVAAWNTYNIDGSKVQTYGTQMTMDGTNMTYTRFRCSDSTDAIKTMTLKSWLDTGPIIVNMTNPGHFILVTGYRDGTIYACDPGMIVSGTGWLGDMGQRRPTKAGCTASFGGDSDKRGYVTIPDTKVNKDGKTWLSTVIVMDKLTFPNIGLTTFDKDPDPSLVCPAGSP
jgi:hypothetical protein